MEHVKNTAVAYKKYLEIDINSKLNPLNKSVDEMLARLEEFETMMTFVVQDRKDYSDILTSVPTYKNDFNNLCDKIDMVDKLMSHIKSNLDELEGEIEKAEINLGCTETATKVTQIFTPLFRKNIDKKQSQPESRLFKTEEYFE